MLQLIGMPAWVGPGGEGRVVVGVLLVSRDVTVGVGSSEDVGSSKDVGEREDVPTDVDVVIPMQT